MHWVSLKFDVVHSNSFQNSQGIDYIAEIHYKQVDEFVG